MDPLNIVIGIIVVAIIVAVIVIYRKNHPSEIDQEWADKFLESLSEYMYKAILDIIAETDFTQFDSIADANNYLLERIYGTIWAYVEQKLAEASDTGIMPKLAAKIITKQYVEVFIKTILEKMDFNKKVSTAFVQPTEFDVTKAIAEDKAMGKQFEDENEYFENGEVKVEDLPEVENKEEAYVDPVMGEEAKPQEIIPPVEADEIPISEDDDTVEIIGDDGLTDAEREAGIHFNKAGRKVDKRGRFVKG